MTTDREIYEYANGALALHFPEDVHALLAEYTPYADELHAMAIIRAIELQPPALTSQSVGETLPQPGTHRQGYTPKHLSNVLQETGTEKGCWHKFFTDLVNADDFLLYDLTSVFSWNEAIKRVEKGYNADDLYRDQIGVILALSTATNLPAVVDVFWGAMKDITTFKEFLDVFDPEKVGLIVDRGLYNETLLEGFNEEGISYVIPLRKNSRLSISAGPGGRAHSCIVAELSSMLGATPISAQCTYSRTPNGGASSSIHSSGNSPKRRSPARSSNRNRRQRGSPTC